MSADDWKKLVDIAGLALLAFTLFLGIASWRIGNTISRRDDAAKLRMESAVLEAKDRLSAQEERTAIAEKATEEIRRDNIGRDERLAASQAEVLTLRGKVATVEGDAAKQLERAAIAERELLELRLKVADRTLAPDQRTQLIAALSDGPKGHVDLFCESSTQEPCKFANELLAALNDAGWETSLSSFVGAPIPPNRFGLVIKVLNISHAPVRAGALQKALDAIGYETPAIAESGLSADELNLYVMAR